MPTSEGSLALQGATIDEADFGLSNERLRVITAQYARECDGDEQLFFHRLHAALVNAGAHRRRALTFINAISERMRTEYRIFVAVPGGLAQIISQDAIVSAIAEFGNFDISFVEAFELFEQRLRDAGARGPALEAVLDEMAVQFLIDRTKRPQGRQRRILGGLFHRNE